MESMTPGKQPGPDETDGFDMRKSMPRDSVSLPFACSIGEFYVPIFYYTTGPQTHQTERQTSQSLPAGGVAIVALVNRSNDFKPAHIVQRRLAHACPNIPSIHSYDMHERGRWGIYSITTTTTCIRRLPAAISTSRSSGRNQ